jgi:hypothetical protein
MQYINYLVNLQSDIITEQLHPYLHIQTLFDLVDHVVTYYHIVLETQTSEIIKDMGKLYRKQNIRKLLETSEERFISLEIGYRLMYDQVNTNNLLFNIACRLRDYRDFYLSLETVLSEEGVISQIPNRLTFISQSKSAVFHTPLGIIEFTKGNVDNILFRKDI